MKKIFIWVGFILAPFLIMFVVNESVNAPTTKNLKDKCTRYCHNVTCTHGNEIYEKYAGTWFADTAKYLYSKNIIWLHNNPFGLSYRAINLVIYVFGLPLIMALLLGNIIRKS